MNHLLARYRLLRRQPAYRLARKIIVAVLGGTVVLVGVIMVVLPGPAILVIPLGLAVLGTEFLWARRWLQRVRDLLPKGRKASPATPGPPSTTPSKGAPGSPTGP